MKRNIGSIMNNNSQLEDIEHSSGQLADTASRFKSKSIQLEVQTRRRNRKMIIYILIFLCLFGFGLWIMAPQGPGHDDEPANNSQGNAKVASNDNTG